MDLSVCPPSAPHPFRISGHRESRNYLNNFELFGSRSSPFRGLRTSGNESSVNTPGIPISPREFYIRSYILSHRGVYIDYQIATEIVRVVNLSHVEASRVTFHPNWCLIKKKQEVHRVTQVYR